MDNFRLSAVKTIAGREATKNRLNQTSYLFGIPG